MQPADPLLEHSARAQLLRDLVRVRLAVVPFLVAVALIVVVMDPAVWRWSLLAVALPALAVYSIYEWRQLGRTGPSRVETNVAVVASAQGVMALATGGLVSPVVVATFLIAFATSATGASTKLRVGIALGQVASFLAFAWIQTTGSLDRFVPELLAGMAIEGPAVGPWVVAGVYSALALATVALGGRVGAVLQRVYGEQIQQRDDVLALLKAHRDELTRLSSEVAHELKNPLASVKGLAALLTPKEEGKARTRWMVLRQEVDRMQDVVEELTTLTRPLLPLERQIVRGDRLLREVSELHAGMAAQRGVGIWLERSEPVSLLCDPRKVRQILTNLIQNGLEASPTGATLRLALSADGEAVHFEVVDAGPGLPEDVAERIFERGVTTKPKGSGIGLTLARTLARQHGGDVGLESMHPGCRARLSLPLGEGAATA